MKHLARFFLAVFLMAAFLGMVSCAESNHRKSVKNYKPDDAVTAANQLKPLAEQGDAEAQFKLGSLYYQGWGVPQDYNEATRWFRKAAGQRHVLAQERLGIIYSKGVQGVIEPDYRQALMWFIIAAAGGDLEAMELRDNLATRMTPVQIAEAQKMAREFKPEDVYTKLLKKLEALAEQGDAHAQLKLGLMYYNGQGVSKDYEKAMQWFKKSALQGNPFAQSNVGYMYEKGEGVPQDYVEAAKWYLQAAERGNTQAQFTLGKMSERGWGMLQDEIQALMWFNIAASRGDEKAKTARDRITLWMSPQQIAEAQSLAREFKILE